jgi:iron complex transport system substrate-binding protein
MSDDHTPLRIACLQPSATAILASLGELDRVVACTRYCRDVVPEVVNGKQKVIADSWTSKADEILSVSPDLIIAAVPYQPAAVAEILKAGVRFLGLAPRTLADIYTDIATIAGIVGASARGAQVIAGMVGAIDNMRLRCRQFQKKRVYCEEWGKPLITSQPWVRELIEAAGGEFVGEPGKQISSNDVVKCDPEVIIAAWCGAGDRVPLPKIIRNRAWTETSAARSGQVYCISDELLNTPGPTLMRGLEALAAALHPETFSSVRGLVSISNGCQATHAHSQEVV